MQIKLKTRLLLWRNTYKAYFNQSYNGKNKIYID